MKLKKFSTAVNFIILCALVSQTTHARLKRASSGSVTSSGGSSSVDHSESVNASFEKATAETCSPKSGDDDMHVSQDFFRSLMSPVDKPNEMFVTRENGKPRVVMPKHINACSKYSLYVATAGNNFYVRVANEYEFDMVNDLGMESNRENIEKVKSMTVEQRTEVCLKHKGYVKDNGELNWDKAVEDGKINYSLRSGSLKLSQMDKKKSVNVYYMSPLASEYGAVFPASRVKTKLNEPCIAYENLGQEDTLRLRTSERDKRMDRANKICESRDPQALIDEIAKSYNDGYPDVAKILEKMFEEVKGPRVEQIYTRMEDIELALKQEGDEKLDEVAALELVGEYADLTDELNKISVTPALNKMRMLMRQRAKGVSKKRREEIDKELNDLKLSIKKFARKSPSKSNLKYVYDAAQDFALTDEIRRIENNRLSSHFHGKMKNNATYNQAIRLADRNIENSLVDYMATTRYWESEYTVRKGGREAREFLDGMKKTVERGMRNLNNDLISLEEENRSKYVQNGPCAPSIIGHQNNSYRCTRWKKNYPYIKEDLLKERKERLDFLLALSERYKEYSKIYEKGAAEARERDIEEDGDFEFIGSRRNKNDDKDERRDDGDDAMSRARNRDMLDYDLNLGRDPMARQVANQGFVPPVYNSPGQSQPNYQLPSQSYDPYQQYRMNNWGQFQLPSASVGINYGYQYGPNYGPSYGPSYSMGQTQIFGPGGGGGHSGFTPSVSPVNGAEIMHYGQYQYGQGVPVARQPAMSNTPFMPY